MQNLFMSYLNWLSYNPLIGLVIGIAAFWAAGKIIGYVIFEPVRRSVRAAQSKEIWNDR